MQQSIRHTCLIAFAAFALSGCSSANIEKEAKYPTGAERSSTEDIYAQPESIFGDKGIMSLGRDKKENDSGITINSYLWRASLDTISFMPLSSADPFGGVIITDRYSPPEDQSERFKLNVFILDKQLRSDAVQVKVFRQVSKRGKWLDTTSSEDTERQLEDTILTRARQMRVAAMGDR